MVKRMIRDIAQDIINDWKNPYYGARPYIQAMAQLYYVEDKYVYETAKDVIIYFLANAQTWRGPIAKQIKAELKELIK